jgi:hypothetical protein
MHTRGIERGVIVEIGQETRKTFGQHRLARTRRANHQDVVTAGSSDFKAEASQSMATNISEIGIANV